MNCYFAGGSVGPSGRTSPPAPRQITACERFAHPSSGAIVCHGTLCRCVPLLLIHFLFSAITRRPISSRVASSNVYHLYNARAVTLVISDTLIAAFTYLLKFCVKYAGPKRYVLLPQSKKLTEQATVLL